MTYELKIQDGRLAIINNGIRELRFEAINTSSNFCPIKWDLGANFSHTIKMSHGVTNKLNDWDKLIITDSHSFFHILVVKNSKLVRISEIEDINKAEVLDFISSPITLVTGHHGGGTSIVTKSLRYLGFNAGGDAGDFKNRKAHESVSFRAWAGKILVNNQDQDFLVNTLKDVVGAYGPRLSNFNLIKRVDLGSENSTVKIGDLFSNLKLVCIVKKGNKSPTSAEGSSFVKADDLQVYKQQFPPIEGHPTFHLNWERYFTDYKYANKLYKFLGLDVELNQSSFNDMLSAINFDSKKL